MADKSIHQPLALKLLHAATGLWILGLGVTGFLLYNTWDGRFGHLPLPDVGETWIDLHASLGEVFPWVLAVFALYSLTLGARKLVAEDTLQKLIGSRGKSQWIAVQRIINTGLLFAAVMACVSGQWMDEDILEKGFLGNLNYNLHIGSWLLICSLLIAHVLIGIKVGGIPLTLSIFDPRLRQKSSNSI